MNYNAGQCALENALQLIIMMFTFYQLNNITHLIKNIEQKVGFIIAPSVLLSVQHFILNNPYLGITGESIIININNCITFVLLSFFICNRILRPLIAFAIIQIEVYTFQSLTLIPIFFFGIDIFKKNCIEKFTVSIVGTYIPMIIILAFLYKKNIYLKINDEDI